MSLVLRQTIVYFAQVLQFLIFIRFILSWIPISRSNAVVQLVYTLTEPMLGPIRELLRKSPLGGPGMMLDFSPFIVLILIDFIKTILLRLL